MASRPSTESKPTHAPFGAGGRARSAEGAERAEGRQADEREQADPTGASALLEAIRAPLAKEMSLFAYRGFLEPLWAGDVAVDEGGAVVFTIYAPSVFLADWVKTHYGAALQQAAADAMGRPASQLSLKVVCGGATTTLPPQASSVSPSSSSVSPTSRSASPSPSSQGEAEWAAPSTSRPLTHTRPSSSAAGSSARSGPSGPSGRRAADSSGDVVTLQPRRDGPPRRLDHRYTFDSFVVGAGSRMAYSAATQVAERPGARYTPLFIFGPTGLGKTHLLHAVGHEILARHPQHRVAMMSAEQWVNEFIETSHDKRFDAFRRRYRDDVDVLLIDDIQFLAGKPQSQDEFFHTFNALYEAHKQIVVTSDRFPHEIAGLEDRLKTRFQWGLVADVRPPDAETRRQILARKAIDLGCALPNEVLEFVAGTVTTSVRALEGALTRLVAWSQLTREPLSLAEAKEQLRPTLQAGAQSPLSVNRIIDVVATYHGMRAKDLTGPSRQRQITRARQIAMFLARAHLQMSLPELGRAFGGRDHTTVMASVSKIERQRGEDTSLQALVGKLEQTLF
jgi:chromosomal replication initiator protein